MPFSSFNAETHKLLRHAFDGSMLILEAMKSDGLSDERRAGTIAEITRRLAAAASEGVRDLSSLQLKALDGLD